MQFISTAGTFHMKNMTTYCLLPNLLQSSPKTDTEYPSLNDWSVFTEILSLLETKFPELSRLLLILDTKVKSERDVRKSQLGQVEHNIHKALEIIDGFFTCRQSLDLTVYPGELAFEKYVEKAKDTGTQFCAGNWEFRVDAQIWREVGNGRGYWVKTGMMDHHSPHDLYRPV